MAETTTLTLAEFLLARSVEDEDRAHGDIDHFGGTSDPRDQWIALMAGRILAECEVKRLIVEEHIPGDVQRGDHIEEECLGCGSPCPARRSGSSPCPTPATRTTTTRSGGRDGLLSHRRPI